jgi:hypothetical protein
MYGGDDPFADSTHQSRGAERKESGLRLNLDTLQLESQRRVSERTFEQLTETPVTDFFPEEELHIGSLPNENFFPDVEANVGSLSAPENVSENQPMPPNDNVGEGGFGRNSVAPFVQSRPSVPPSMQSSMPSVSADNHGQSRGFDNNAFEQGYHAGYNQAVVDFMFQQNQQYQYGDQYGEDYNSPSRFDSMPPVSTTGSGTRNQAQSCTGDDEQGSGRAYSGSPTPMPDDGDAYADPNSYAVESVPYTDDPENEFAVPVAGDTGQQN